MSFRGVNPRLLFEIVCLHVVSVQKMDLKMCLMAALLKVFSAILCEECSEWQSFALLPRVFILFSFFFP